MRSRKERQRVAWRLIAGETGIVAILLVLLAAVEASVDGQTIAGFLQATILLGTAGIVWWYTKETQRLREAAQRQTEITQQIFEASHRPYVTVKAEEPMQQFRPAGQPTGRLSCKIVFENHGSVPAAIKVWELRGSLKDYDGHENPVERMDPIESPVGRYLAPRTPAAIVVHFVGGDLPNPVLPFRLYGSVEYRGLGTWTYRTDFDAQRGGEGKWTAQGYMMT